MPLPKDCSMKTFYKTVEIERKNGRKLNQAIAIAYSHLKKVCGVDQNKRLTPSQIVVLGRGTVEDYESNVIPGGPSVGHIMRFYQEGDSKDIQEFEYLIAHGKVREAIKILEKFLGGVYSIYLEEQLNDFLGWWVSKDDKVDRIDGIKNDLMKISLLLDSELSVMGSNDDDAGR